MKRAGQTAFGRSGLLYWRSICSVALRSKMRHSAEVSLQNIQNTIQRRYEAISQDPRYGQYVRIPGRICRCLDYFKVSSNRRAVEERLHSYYLFIGVVDDVMDSGRIEAGREILEQLQERQPLFKEDTIRSSAKLVTEVLKCTIGVENYPVVLAKLEELLSEGPGQCGLTSSRGKLWAA